MVEEWNMEKKKQWKKLVKNELKINKEKKKDGN